ncbi:MAG: fatty acid oxidation complex subunit alpha FadB [Panacagrimonas sp.]
MTERLYTGQCLRLLHLDDGLVELQFDRQNEALNKLDGALIAELRQAVDLLASVHSLRGLLVSSAKDAFLAGADIAVLWSMFDRSAPQLVAFCEEMDRALTRLDDLPVPVVCAINGFALGGGLEVALCSDYRVMAANAQIGFPEVGLGILPAAGGSVRTPRLTNCTTALDWLCNGRSRKAEAALSAGMIDEISEPTMLRESALNALGRLASGELDWKARREQRRGPCTLDASALAAAREQAGRASRHYPAALAVADLIERSAPLRRDAAFALEAQTFATLMSSPTAKAMVAIFLSNQQLKKLSKARGTGGRKIGHAAVLGAGIMGGGVAYTTAVRGMPVLLKDIAQAQLDLGMNEARKLLARQVETGKLKTEQAARILGSIEPILAFERFERADIVVEAVVENLKLKQDVLAQVQARVKPGTVLASNTSSLSIAEIAAPLARPEDVVGMHFFNPVHVMPLVEVIRGPKSSEAAVATTVAYALAMGKTPLVVKDCPGFLINRILGAYFSAFQLLIRDGADYQQIDRVMESYGWPMGPAYLLDVAGIDTLDKAMRILGLAYPAVMSADYSTIIQRLAGEKRYGQKTGAGFYRYEADAKGRPRRSGDPSVASLIASVQTDGAKPFADEDILDRMMLAMMLEAARCLDDHVVGTAVEIDTGMRLGTGFPAHHVGPLWAAQTLGLDEVMRRCEKHKALGGAYVAPAGLRGREQAGQCYYPTSFL